MQIHALTHSLKQGNTTYLSVVCVCGTDPMPEIAMRFSTVVSPSSPVGSLTVQRMTDPSLSALTNSWPDAASDQIGSLWAERTDTSTAASLFVYRNYNQLNPFSLQKLQLCWRRGIVVSGVHHMNEVNARRARLVPKRVTVFGRVYHLGM